MKNIITLIACVAIVVSFTACKDEKDGKLDPNAKVYINGKDAPQSAPEVKTAGEQQKLTIRQVVEQATVAMPLHLGIDDWNRDLVNNRIVGVSTWVVQQNGELTLELITCRDLILATKNEKNRPKDTIAYLPNSVMIEAEKKIRAAYDAKDYAACYKLFEEAFVFVPTTGKEWRELKKQGKN